MTKSLTTSNPNSSLYQRSSTILYRSPSSISILAIHVSNLHMLQYIHSFVLKVKSFTVVSITMPKLPSFVRTQYQTFFDYNLSIVTL